ncbi:N1R/p28-like protein [Mythimna separata entomopoxvirus 'L']|uniref:N1R/p28-like protein n=1 Tax=Mythimna separata entomopoxvirus 'L' TaxID=1293572 RepID=A0A916KQ37_9POXV|nr:N1R/p28-like protein [Mythimna separata entomopoxvirus 'L']CCU56257.1 N1R/p28-like protein [Mythimna separata entomopoxvirus 'L']
MNSLNDICYEHIKDTFYYGLFGNFKLVIDKNTGCFNATKLCNLGSKRYRNWLSLERSKELIKFIDKNRRLDHSAYFYEINDSNKNHISKQITGQYVPKEIILDISSWISVEFYLKCNDIIINYYNKEFKNLSDQDIQNKVKEIEDNYKNIIDEKDETIKIKDDKIDYLIEQNNKILESHKKLEEKSSNLEIMNRELLDLAKKQNIKLDENKEELTYIKDELEDTNYKLDTLTDTVETVIIPDRNISPSDDKLKHNLAIYKNKDEIRIIRAQNKLSTNKLKNIDTKDIIINEYVPNPIDFINRMKLKCNVINKEIKKNLKNSNKNMNYEELNELYDDSKLFEIKYSHILLNNSKIEDIRELFDELKKEQYNY